MSIFPKIVNEILEIVNLRAIFKGGESDDRASKSQKLYLKHRTKNTKKQSLGNLLLVY